eukprot:snap_masked-scaffold_19-processed-gene-6.41-mRNA-1 protein AED:1.00 eAED:1.00 QI:0/0/0/0/1/1/2/0/84
MDSTLILADIFGSKHCSFTASVFWSNSQTPEKKTKTIGSDDRLKQLQKYATEIIPVWFTCYYFHIPRRFREYRSHSLEISMNVL